MTPKTRPGTHLYAAYSSADQPSWFVRSIRNWIDPEYNRSFFSIRLDGDLLSDVEVARDIGSSYGAQEIDVACSSMSPEFAAALLRAKGLKVLSIQYVLRYGGSPRSEEFSIDLSPAKELEMFWANDLFLSPQLAENLVKLPSLRKLRLGCCAPETFAALAKSPRLESIAIAGFRHSATDFREPKQTAEDFAQRTRQAMQQALGSLADNPHFVSLGIHGSLGLQPNDWTEFCRRSNLQSLNLQSPEMAPECVAQIAKLPNLESLTIYDLALRGEHLAPLTGAKKLKTLLVGPNVSREEADALRKAMPQCKIERF